MTEWINPYRLTKRSADTLNLIEERRLVGLTNAESARRPPTWKFVGGNPGSWSEIALTYADLFYTAGLIQLPDGPSSTWRVVQLSKAGHFLWHTWVNHPFEVSE